MRTTSKIGLGAATLAVAAGAVTAGTAVGSQAAGEHRVVEATASPAPGASAKVAGRAGWQGKFVYSLPAGSGGVFFHYPCPTNFVARSGAFDVSAAGQAGVKLVGQGPRWDQNYTEWFNTLLWPGGAPSGVTISFDVYCTKTPI